MYTPASRAVASLRSLRKNGFSIISPLARLAKESVDSLNIRSDIKGFRLIRQKRADFFSDPNRSESGQKNSVQFDSFDPLANLSAHPECAA